MRKFLLSALLILSLSSPSFAWKPAPSEKQSTPKQDEESVMTVTWEGSSDEDMLKKVREDLKSAAERKGIKTLKVFLSSPGGSVVTSLEIARLVRDASEKGLIVEIHGAMLVASGGTFILAAGTPGKRYISRWALFLVHAPQVGGGFFSPPTCGTFKDKPENETEKLVNAVLVLMRDSYVRFTGKSEKEVEDWISCGWEAVGDGRMAVQMGLADVVE